MNYMLFVFVFIIILFLYLHIYYHIKVSDDLEVYELENPTKEKLEEICDLRQPVLFNYKRYGDELIEKCKVLNVVNSYGVFDVLLRNMKTHDDGTEQYLPFVLNETIELLKNDEENKYISEKNGEFLEETGLIKIFRQNDGFLRPPMVSRCMYDYIVLGKGANSVLRKSIEYRSYYMVTEGECMVKLISPKNEKYLRGVKRYNKDVGEYESEINPWKEGVSEDKEYGKVKELEIRVKEGEVLNVPAYWWMSIKSEEVCGICKLEYRTYMSGLSLLGETIKDALQKRNVKLKM